MVDGRTLREVSFPSPRSPSRQYAWRPGSIPLFSSLWVTIYRFTLLNRPSFTALKMDLQGKESVDSKGAIYLDSLTPWPKHSSICLSNLSEILKEPIQSFKWSSSADLPNSLRHAIHKNTKICPTCFAQGFHSIIFSATYIKDCPHHGCKLLDVCPRCGHSFLPYISYAPGVLPRICKCEQPWLTPKIARRPTLDLDRDNLLHDILNWSEKVSARYWTYIPRPRTNHSHDQNTHLTDHFLNWSSNFGEIIPLWLVSPEPQRRTSSGLDLCSEHSGIKLESLARLSDAGNAYICGIRDLSGSPHHKEVVLLFKCIRRYLIKHLIANRVHLLVKVGSCLSAPDFRRLVQSCELGKQAWSILYWMQRSFWGRTNVREWFLKIKGFSTFCHEQHDPTRHWCKITQNHIFVNPGCQAERWITDWINASALIDLWPDRLELDIFLSDDGFIKSAYTNERRNHINWWSWIDDEKMLNFASLRRSALGWASQVARSVPKSERRFRQEARRVQVFEQRRRTMCEPALMLHDDGVWRVKGRMHLPDNADLRYSRVSIGFGSALRFGVYSDAALKPYTDNYWFLRCLDFPVCVQASSTQDGVKKLKSSLRFYVRHLSKSLSEE